MSHEFSKCTDLCCTICINGEPDTPKQALPAITEMSGFIHDFTNGKSLKEYMEELSDESE